MIAGPWNIWKVCNDETFGLIMLMGSHQKHYKTEVVNLNQLKRTIAYFIRISLLKYLIELILTHFNQVMDIIRLPVVI